MSSRQQLGKSSEDFAIQFLKKQGYKILNNNYRCPLGEIDVIAAEKDTVVFVEVRSRTNSDSGLPLETINFAKKRHIIRSALYYQKKYNLYDYNMRFDVISILNDGKVVEIELIKDAFDERGY